MKTSILVSGIAALYLAIGVTGMSRHQNEDEMNFTTNNEITISTIKMATMLPGVTVIADRKNESEVTAPAASTEDYSYLKFDVNKYMEDEVSDQDESMEMPATPEADYSYLKFDVTDYTSASEITELPEAESTNNDFSSESSIDNFGYLKFDVNKYIESSESSSDDLGELPAVEKTTVTAHNFESENAQTSEFNYLKFDVTKYYKTGEADNDGKIEMPE